VVIIISFLLGALVATPFIMCAKARRALRVNTARERLRANAIVRDFIKEHHREFWRLDEKLPDKLWALASLMQKESIPEVDEWVSKAVAWTEMGGRI
jgi:hypothetical protein